MTVALLLKNKPTALYSIGPDASVSECINLLNEKGIGALLVLDPDGRMEGIVSERDILRSAYARQCQICELPVRSIMTPHARVVTAAKTDSLAEVMEMMTKNHIRHLPIVEGGRPVAVISIGDVVKQLLDHSAQEGQQLKDYVMGRYT